jgi:long-chain acyl-CoA synthetase
MGIELLEIYGLTECGGLATAVPAGAMRPSGVGWGSVGRVVGPGELALDETGEVLLRGPQVCLGYWNRPELTASVLRDGWLRTGDLGELRDGWLSLRGRAGEVLVTGTGMQVASAEIENTLKLSPYIADALVVGAGRDSLSCLVMIEHETVEKWAQDNNVPFTSFASLVAAEPVRGLIAAEVARLNGGTGPDARIAAFRLIGRRLEPTDRELTPMMKLKRHVVLGEFGELIDEMYRAA